MEIHGVDNDPEMVEFARERLDKAYLSDMEDLPPEVLQNRYGTIVLLESLEHVRNPEMVLRVVNELLMDDGLLLIIVPLDTLLFRLIWWIWTNSLGKRWKHMHKYNFKSPRELFNLLERWFKVLEYKRTNFGCILIVLCKKAEV